MNPNPKQQLQKDFPRTKPVERGNLKTEIEQIRRIVNGANKRLERLAEQLKDKS